MASNTTQVPIEVKLQISNQAQVMRKLANEFQDVFSNVDPGTAFGKKLAKAFSKIDNKLISAESLLGKDFFSESDMLRVTKYIESISEAMGEINTRAQSMSAKGLGLDTAEIEKAHQAVVDLQKTITEQKKAKVGSILAVDSKDFQELSALSSKSGFSGGKNFANNISAMNVSVGKLRQEWAELTNAAKEAEQAQQNALKTKVQANLKVNAAQAELDKRANFNEDVAQQVAAVKLGGTKGRGIQQVISDYQQLLTEQLEGTDWKTGGFDFAQVIAGWLEVDPSELEGAATEVVQKLQFAIQEKLQKDALKKSNLLRSNAEAVLSGQKDVLNKDSGYTQRNQQAMEASAELQSASTTLDEANKNLLNVQTNAKNCEELLNKITAQIERLKELQKQYNDLVDKQNKEELDNARQREQQARRMAEEPTKEESQNIYKQTSENVKKTQQISAENVERNRIQKQHELEQEALEREAEQFTSNLKQSIRQWMSAQQVINLIKQGIRQAYQDIQGLDKAMTNIAVVTDMSVSDLWGKINDYMSIAQQYGVTTQGVYEVSQLYYQQGLGTDEVMAATTETLKMARIAGMEYAEAADAMTVAIRAFKMEMSEAVHVTDVYSKVAAVTASDTEELAIAMSKTASSAESVGSSFENTTAMLAVMIETTRESAQNLGSALKSIISRYGEMKTGLTVDSEGELIDYNKVDTALKSVGISLKDTQGQFRDFDEVIFELSSKWDTLDKNTQRYIATVMAGNRQQSRFIALVDNWERLDEVSKSAEDSEDAGLLQYSKTLDSLETKINNIKTSFQQFYMDIFNGPLIGKGLEFINNIIKGFNKLGKLSSILNISSIIGAVKVISTVFVSNFANSFRQISNAWKGTLREMSSETSKSAKEQGLKWYQGFTEKNNQGKTVLSKKGGRVATGAMMAGSILSMVGSSVASKNQTAGAWLSAGGNALSIGAQLAMINPILGLVGGGIAGFVTLLTSLPSKMEKAQQELEKATEKANEANIKRAETKDRYNNLNEYLTKLENLEKTRYDSQENYDEWVKVNNQALEAFPELASTFDAANNAVVDLTTAENNLTQARLDAQKAAKEAADAQIAAALTNQKIKEKEFLDAEQNRLNFTDNTNYLIVGTKNNPTTIKEIDNRFIGDEGFFGWWWDTAFSKEEIQKASSQRDLVMPYSYKTTNLLQKQMEGLLAEGHIMYFGQEEGGKDYNLIVMNDELGDASDLLDLEGNNREQIFNWLLTLNTTDPNKYTQNLALGFQSEFLKKGKTEEDFIKAATGGIYTSKQELLQLSQLERDAKLSQKATENTIRAGIGTYLSSEFMWEDKEESFTGLANVNKVFQEALYKDFTTFLKEGNKEITEESWKEWINGRYNNTYTGLQENYKKFYDTLSLSGQIEDYNLFETKADTLTIDEYERRLGEFGAEEDLQNELIDQFTEEYNEARKKFSKAIENVSFLGRRYEDYLFKPNSDFVFRQEYSDEIISQARQLEEYIEAGQMTTKQAREYFTNYINLWETLEVNEEQLKPDQLEQIRTILSQTDFTAPEGIVESFRQIGEIYTEAGLEIPENFSLDSTNILKYIDPALVNLNTSYNTLASKIGENIDLISKQIDKAINGFDSAKDLVEFSGKYGLTADDFIFDALTGKWKASKSVYNAILEKEKLNLEDQQKVIDEVLNQQKDILSNSKLTFDAKKYKTYEQFKEAQLANKDNIKDYERVNAILEKNWDNYITAWEKDNTLSFYEYLEQYANEQLEALQKDSKELEDYYNYIGERQGIIDSAETGNLEALKKKYKIESQKILSQNYSALTKGQIAAINQDLGIDLNKWAKDNKDGTFDVSSFINSSTFKNLPIETQNAILSSIDAEFNAASEAMSNLGSAAAGKADPGVYYEALKESGLSYDMLETLIPENIRLAAQGNKESEEALRGILKAANIEDVDTVYNNLINNYYDTTKANVFTALDSIEKALDGTLDAQEFTELKTLDFGSYKIDFSAINSSGELTLERYWQIIAEAIRNGASEADWGQYFEKAAKRSFDSAFGLEELEFDKEVAEASGKFSQKLITDIAKQAKQILSPDVLNKFFVYDKITETYSANIQAIMAEAKLTEAEARSQWALQASVLMGFDYNAVMASFAGQDYSKLIKTDSIESSLNELIAAPNNITLENIKSLYEEIHGAGTFVVSQDVAAIDSFIQQAQEGAYDQIIGYIRNLYNEAIAAGYDVDTSEITTLIQQFYESIAKNLKSALSDGIEGNLDTTTYNDLVKKYNVSGIKTTTGYGLTDDSQRKIISEWYKAAQASGSILGFGEELWKTWADSTEAPLKSYRAISAEIEKAINKTDGLVSATDEYVAALQQARAAAYLDPSAYEFSFMEQDATGGLTKNFDNFVSQIDTVKATLNSLKSGTAIGYQEFYNLIDFIDNSGQWNTVSQKLGQGGKDIQEFANTIVEASGELGKVDAKGFAKIGLDMAASSKAMTEGMADGLKEVADQQVKYLEGLEKMLLAMQALSEIGDISLGLSLDVNGQSMYITLSQLEDFKAQLLEQYPIDKINYEINKALTSQASTINSAFELAFGAENFDFMQLFFGGSFDFNDTEIQIADALGTYLSLLPNLTKDQAMSVGEQLFAAVGEGFVYDEQGNITGINDSFQQLFTNFFKSFDVSKISKLSTTAVREALGTAIEKEIVIDGKTFKIKLGENGVPIVEPPNGVTIDESNKKDFESVIAKALGLEQVSIDLKSLEIKGLKDKDSDEDNTLEVEANISPELQAVLDLIKNNPTIAITLSDEAWALLEALQPEIAKRLKEQAEKLKTTAEAETEIKETETKETNTEKTGSGERQAEIADLEEQITTLTTDKANLEEQITTLTTKIADLEEQITTLTTDKANLEEQITTLTADKANLEEQIETLTATKEEKSNTIARLESSIANYTTTITELETTINAKDAEINELKAANEQLKAELSKGIKELSTEQAQDYVKIAQPYEQQASEAGDLVANIYEQLNESINKAYADQPELLKFVSPADNNYGDLLSEGGIVARELITSYMDDFYSKGYFDTLEYDSFKAAFFTNGNFQFPTPDAEGLAIMQEYATIFRTIFSNDGIIGIDIAGMEEAATTAETLIDSFGSYEEGVVATIATEGEEAASSKLQDLQDQVDTLSTNPYVITVRTKYETEGTPPVLPSDDSGSSDHPSQATGSMNGLALADGSIGRLYSGAQLANKTLVGELGPELAVYDGKYHMLGANGAEFVKLPSDAIVFNHLQTAGILKGQMNVRGQALAEGNVSGPALAGGGNGIGAALEAVRRAKAVWQGLLDNLTAAELTNAAGGGGGGGGVKNHSEELQEWYNLSRQISNIEQEINNILAERENITEGDSYLRSLREQQKLLREQANIQEVLLGYQQLQLKRQADIINNDRLWSRFLEVDESGLLQYTKGNELNGGKGALQVFQEMNEMSGEDQVKFLKDIGYTYTTADGEELKEGELVQKFYEELQKQIDDYDALYDTVHETKETLEGIDTNISEIDEEIKQNQMDLEQAIFDIIVEAWEKQIEQMEEYNDLVKEANDKYIDGLNDALKKEKELYSQNETIAEREQLQRRLSLLRRSGGSASEIASLEEQLDDKLKDEYFKNQEEAIKNIQEANDRQVELLEQQVKLQQDSLEYQKEHGVIWSQVYDIMSGSAEEILAFMQGRKPDFFTQSLLQQEEMLTKWAMEIGIYTEDKQYQNHEAYARGSIWDNGNIFNNDTLKSQQETFNNLTPEQQQQLQEYFSSVYATSRIGGADEETATNEAINALAGKMGDYSEQQGLVSGNNGGKEEQEGNSGNSTGGNLDNRKWYVMDNGGNTKLSQGYNTQGKAEGARTSMISGAYNNWYYASQYGADSKTVKAYKDKLDALNKSVVKKSYSKGGIVDYTGLAMVHGSKSEPESFLNAEQTAQIREALEISGNRNMLEDVRSSLQALQSTIKSITNIANNSETSSITIAPGAVVIEVAELADSYDVDTLSADVMNRIVNIANKRTTRSVNRR